MQNKRTGLFSGLAEEKTKTNMWSDYCELWLSYEVDGLMRQ